MERCVSRCLDSRVSNVGFGNLAYSNPKHQIYALPKNRGSKPISLLCNGVFIKANKMMDEC